MRLLQNIIFEKGNYEEQIQLLLILINLIKLLNILVAKKMFLYIKLKIFYHIPIIYLKHKLCQKHSFIYMEGIQTFFIHYFTMII